MDTPLFGGSSLPEELDARVREELREGERLLWVGQPRPGRFVRQVGPSVFVGILRTAFRGTWDRKQVVYALTDRRAILWEPEPFGGVAVRSYGPADLTELRRVEHPGDIGDLVFEEILVDVDA